MPAALWWIRNDLRLRDNPALLAAIQHGGPVIPVFIHSPKEHGDWQPGAASRWWLHHSLLALRKSLVELGSRLVIRRSPSLAALRQLALETGATAVYWNRCYEPALAKRDARIDTSLIGDGLAVETFNASLLFEPGSIRTVAGSPYQVFTPFYHACRLLPPPPKPRVAPKRLTAPNRWPKSLDVPGLELLPRFDWAAGLRQVWRPGEDGARREFARFRKVAGKYAVSRDLPARAGTSRLSPHLHFGEISPREVWHGLDQPAYRRQLVWREFAWHLLHHFPHTATAPLREKYARFPWVRDAAALKAWQRGRTGYPLVDAGMRELWATGWMHNRVRMVVASFLVKHLLTSWREGAAWFWDTLVDADLANNTLGWQWAAGCGADAAPYFRIFNPALQAKKFDPKGEYIRRWVKDTQPPIVDHQRARKRALDALASLKGG